MTDRREFTKRAFRLIDQVYREGSTAHVELPQPETGVLIPRQIDQRGASEIIARLCGLMVSDLKNKLMTGQALAGRERRIWKIWQEQVPFRFTWLVTPDGRHLLLPLNVSYGHCSSPPLWWELASHPSTYDVSWRVPPLQIDDDGFGHGVISFVRAIDEETTILTRLSKLDRLDSDLWERRLSHG